MRSRRRRLSPKPVYPRPCGGARIPIGVSFVRITVYPRPCGGAGSFSNEVYPWPRCTGLSPPVRGSRRDDPSSAPFKRGLSPPVRGSPTTTLSARLSLPAVYPRPCGGATECPPAFRLLRGSIPARAGEPPPRVYSTCTNRVYPRPCGGAIAACLPVAQLGEGLSPPVRGSPGTPSPCTANSPGSIPARAGEPPCLPNGTPIGSIPARAGEPSRDAVYVRGRSGSIPARAGEPADLV